MRRGASFALFGVVALACVPVPARAQDIQIIAPAPSALPEAGPPAEPLTPSESLTLGNALMFDPGNINTTPAPKLRVPSLAKPRNLSVDGGENPDGTRKIAVKQPIATGEWDANVGADLKTATAPRTTFEPGKAFPGTADDQGSGAAWASVGVPNLASVDARLDPTNEQSQVGAALKRSLPLGEDVSMTVQNKVTMTETYNTAPVAPAPLSDLPLMAAPKPTEPIQPGAPQVLGTERSVKFDFKPTGTSFAAGLTSASNDPVTHNTLTADQKLFGPLHVTTAVTDFGQASSNKSITAKFKVDW